MSVVIQYYGPIRQDAVLVDYLGSKEYVQEKLLTVGLVQNSDKVRYAKMKQFMHNSYGNGDDC